MARKDLDEVPSLVYNKTTKKWTRNGKPITEGYKYYDTKGKQTRVFHNGNFISENDYRFAQDKKDNNIRKVIKSALMLNPLTMPIGITSKIIDGISEIGTKHSSGGADPLSIAMGAKYTGLHKFGNNKYQNVTSRSNIISGRNARGNQAILDYYLKGIDTGLNKSNQEPIRIKNNKSFNRPNVDYNFLPVDTLTLTDDWKPTIDSLSRVGLQNIDNYYFIDDYDKQATVIRDNPRYKDKTVYDYGRAKAKILKDNNGNYTFRTIDLFDTGKTVGPLGIALEAIKKVNPLVVRHDNPIRFIKSKDSTEYNQDNDLLYNLMIRE